MALKPLALECHINLPNHPSKLNYIISEDARPTRKPKNGLFSLAKVQAPQYGKRVYGMPHDGSTTLPSHVQY
jgi:hypothetical protein